MSCLRISIVAFVSAIALLGAPHRLRVYPNASISILSIAEAADGFLWLAAEDGLYRFDGLHYQKMTGFPLSSARFVGFTEDGTLWAGGREGLVRYQDHHFQQVLREEVRAVAVFPEQLLVQRAAGQRGVRVRPDGSVEILPEDFADALMVDSEGRVWFKKNRVQVLDPNHPEAKVLGETIAFGFQQAVRDNRGRLWAADESRAVVLKEGRETEILTRRPSQKTQRPGPLLSGRNGQLWFLGETIRGLVNPIEFHDRVLNDQYQPTAGFEDSRGHFWTARLGQGLVEWLTEPAWQRWSSEDFGGKPSAQVVRTPDGVVISASHGKLHRLNPSSSTWLQMGQEDHEYDAILGLENGEFLASIRKIGVVRLSPDGNIVEHLPNPLPSADDYRNLLRDGKGRTWVGSKLGFFQIEGSPGALRLRSWSLPGFPKLSSRNGPQPVALDLDKSGHLWVGYAEGLVWLGDDDQWRSIPTEQPISEIRSFALADQVKGEDIWAAYRHSGPFIRLQKQGAQWKVTNFAPAEGYGPPDTHFIRRDSRGWIWRGSTDGVHISDGSHFEPNDWIHISSQNGLATGPTDQYGFFEDRDGTVWISGEDGVSHLRPETWWFETPRAAKPPAVTRVRVDGREVDEGVSELPVPKEFLTIDIGSLETPPFRDYPFRYRLQPLFTDWRLSRDGSLDFRDIPAGAYTLEVAYTGLGVSPALTYPLRITPPQARLNWTWFLVVPLSVAALALLIRWLPWPEGIRYRWTKGLFILRRRFASQNAALSDGPATLGRDYSGKILQQRYYLDGPVSKGGFSVVYGGHDLRNDNAHIAVKILNAAPTNESWLRDRFAHEVAALRSVTHPSVVTVIDSWISENGDPCLAMPFLDGPTLRDLLKASSREKIFDPRRVGRLTNQLGGALAEIHSHGIVHRDLKPENIIVMDCETPIERPVLIDFGTAGLRGHQQRLTATTLLSGSFHYMAPERLTGHYSPASDLYSLGVIILEMLTGKRLVDLGASPGDDGFCAELERAVQMCMELKRAHAVAVELAKSYTSRPQERPVDAHGWAITLGDLLDQV